jgi:hypothetical protein
VRIWRLRLFVTLTPARPTAALPASGFLDVRQLAWTSLSTRLLGTSSRRVSSEGELLLVIGSTDFTRHILPKEYWKNRMSGHRGCSRGCGCRLAKGLHGYRLVLPDVEDGI